MKSFSMIGREIGNTLALIFVRESSPSRASWRTALRKDLKKSGTWRDYKVQSPVQEMKKMRENLEQ